MTHEHSTAKETMPPPKADSYTSAYIWGAVSFALLLWAFQDLDRVFDSFLLSVPMLFAPALLLLGALLIGLGSNLIRRRWRRCLSIIAAPIIAASLYTGLQSLGLTSTFVHFELLKPTYLAQVNAARGADSGPTLKAWDWGSTGGAAVTNVFWILVYDESDQIALPRLSRSAGWLRKAGQVGSILYSVAYPEQTSAGKDPFHTIVHHLDGHFYLVVQSYP